MGETRFFITNSDRTKGSEFTYIEFMKLIKLTRYRNRTLHRKLIEDYEFITGEKLDLKILKTL
jgi:hypothetical protein